MFRFRKSIKILPGLRLNLGRKSASVSVGVRNLTANIKATGQVRTTVSAPGTGWSWVKFWK